MLVRLGLVIVNQVSLIKPYIKSGSKLQLENYRPISLTSNLAKLLEKTIKR